MDIELAEEIRRRISDHIYNQFHDPVAQKELVALGPNHVDWVKRTKNTLDILLPELPLLANYIFNKVPQKLNSASHLLSLIHDGTTHLKDILSSSGKARDWFSKVIAAAEAAKSLIGNIQSQQVSAEVQRSIFDINSIKELLHPNGNSIYPDLFLRNADYGMLPKQSKRNPIDGPCLRGTRPSNVPDGCEIKSNQGVRMKVDAHGAHAGLHIGVTWDLLNDELTINGVWAGYIKLSDHTESERSVNVTTVKYSFGHDLFVSLL